MADWILVRYLVLGVNGPISMMEAGGNVHGGLALGQVLALLVLALQGVHGVVPGQKDLWRRHSWGGWCFTSLLRSCSESAFRL